MKTYRAWQMKPEAMAVQMLNAYGLMIQGLNDEEPSMVLDLNDYELTYEREGSGEVMEGLNDFYQFLNEDDRPTREFTHSMSVGDVIEVDEEYYQVAPMGFKKVLMA